MIVYFFWLIFAALAALVIGLAALRMRELWGENPLIPPLTRFMGAVALLCLGLVWLAIRGIESYRGGAPPLGALILTAFLFPLVLTGALFAADILGLVHRPKKEDDHDPE